MHIHQPQLVQLREPAFALQVHVRGDRGGREGALRRPRHAHGVPQGQRAEMEAGIHKDRARRRAEGRRMEVSRQYFRQLRHSPSPEY